MKFWVSVEDKGLLGSEMVRAFYVHTEKGCVFGVLNLGISVVQHRGFTADGLTHNLVLANEDAMSYAINKAYLGCVIGRYAGRIGKASFDLDGTQVALDSNENGNTLHGGHVGLGRVVWDVSYDVDHEGVRFVFKHFSPAGTGGFPGNVHFEVSATIQATNKVTWIYEAVSDSKTAISLTHHTYYNLNANHSEISDHLLSLQSNCFLMLDTQNVPTEKKVVFNAEQVQKKPLKMWFEELGCKKGLDHAFELTRFKRPQVAILKQPVTGLTLSVDTDCPYMVVYTGGFLKRPFTGICFETQEVPNGPNLKELGYVFLKPNEKYRRFTTISISSS